VQFGKVHSSTARRSLEDLELLGVLNRVDDGKRHVWCMGQAARQVWERGFEGAHGRVGGHV